MGKHLLIQVWSPPSSLPATRLLFSDTHMHVHWPQALRTPRLYYYFPCSTHLFILSSKTSPSSYPCCQSDFCYSESGEVERICEWKHSDQEFGETEWQGKIEISYEEVISQLTKRCGNFGKKKTLCFVEEPLRDINQGLPAMLFKGPVLKNGCIFITCFVFRLFISLSSQKLLQGGWNFCYFTYRQRQIQFLPR